MLGESSLCGEKMQRQSLGSPGSNHHNHAPSTGEKTAVVETSEDSKRLPTASGIDADDEEKTKLLKSHRSSPTASKKSERLIHGIPVLTFVCFLILYLSSRDPSQLEVDAVGGFKKEVVAIDSRNARKGDGSGSIGRERKLREITKQGAWKSRKLGDF